MKRIMKNRTGLLSVVTAGVLAACSSVPDNVSSESDAIVRPTLQLVHVDASKRALPDMIQGLVVLFVGADVIVLWLLARLHRKKKHARRDAEVQTP